MKLYDYAQTLGKFGEKLIADIDEEANKRDGISPHEVTHGSYKLLNWKCSVCGHQYKMSPKQRIRTNCSVCYGRTVMKGYNDAYTWCLNHGEFGKRLIEEFDTEENEIQMDEITYGSNKVMHWKCNKGHKWTAMMGKRTTTGIGCPHCNTNGASFPENYIYNALKSVIPNVERNYRIPKSLGGYELDICIPDYKTVIEYDGAKWHTAPIDGEFPVDSKEYIKTEICKQYGLRLIHIYDGGKCKEPILHNDIIIYKYTSSNCDQLEIIVQILLEQLHINETVKFDLIKNKALSEKKAIKIEDSLTYKFPEVAAEWDYENNGDYTPDIIKAGSNYKVHWIDKYGHRWETTVRSRTNNKNGCPICAGKKLLEGFNDLKTKLPELAKEWHPTLNDTEPTKIIAKSSKMAYWQCTKCGYGENGEWRTRICRRSAKGYETGCPQCKYNWFTKKYYRNINVHRTVTILV